MVYLESPGTIIDLSEVMGTPWLLSTYGHFMLAYGHFMPSVYVCTMSLQGVVVLCVALPAATKRYNTVQFVIGQYYVAEAHQYGIYNNG